MRTPSFGALGGAVGFVFELSGTDAKKEIIIVKCDAGLARSSQAELPPFRKFTFGLLKRLLMSHQHKTGTGKAYSDPR